MKCKKCACKNDKGMKFCKNCGNNLEKENNNTKKKKKLILIISCIAVVSTVLFIVLFFTVFNKPDKNQLMQQGLTDYFEINDEVNEIKAKFTETNGYVSHNNVDKAINAVGEYAEELFSNGQIKEYEITEGYSVWIKFNSGPEYVYSPAIEGTDSSDISTYQPCLSTYNNDLQKYSKECVDKSAENIQNIIDDYKFVNNYDDADITLEVLSDIGKNKVVIWHGHGGYSKQTHSFLSTGLELDEEKFLWDPIYYIKNIGYTDEYLGGELIFTDSGHIAVGNKYFENHLHEISGSIIYLGTCSSGVDDVLAQTFLNKGAASVIANSGTICTRYNLSMIKTIFEQMLKSTGSDNHYDTFQTALGYAFDKNGEYCCESAQSHPIIFGKKDFRLTENDVTKVLNSDFVSGKYLIDIDGELICAKSDAIYYKESINSEEKKIAYSGNVESLLSDGETVYYVEGFDNSNVNFDKKFNPKKVYRSKVSGSKSDYIFTSKGYADLITYKDGCIYYLDTTKQGDSYKCSLIKYDTDTDSAVSLADEWSGNVPVYWKQNAYSFDNTIFFTKNNSLYAYDIAANKTELIVSSSKGEICEIIDGKVCFEYTNNNSNYIAMVDDDKNVETSVAIDAKYDLQAVTDDGKYGLYFTNGFDDFNLFTIDLKTGESSVSEGDAGGCKGKNYFVTKDLEHPENIYFMYSVRLYDENKKTTEPKKHDEFEIIITKPMWIIDGYIVDLDLNTYKIYDETIEYSNSVQSTNEEKTSEWQNLYTDYVDSLNEAYEDILIVYIDDDDIPELYILGKFHMAGAVLCWIDNGEVKSKTCGQSFGYTEKSGKCYAYVMQMGVSQLTEYTLKNGNLTEKKIASSSENNNSYTWNEETVSQGEFWEKYNAYVNKYTTPDISEYITREEFDTVIKSY